MAYVYHPPIVTVDAVIFRLINDKLHVLLVERANEPFMGAWALPGGYNAAGNTTLQALDRVLQMKVGLRPADFPLVEQIHAFDTVARDPRGHAISITFMCLGSAIEPEISESTQNPKFHPVHDLPPLAYDHAAIVEFALDYLRRRMLTTSIAYTLLPLDFTLTQLQGAYEAVLGRVLDKRNFRKKFLSFDILAPSDKYYQDGAHRPALLYHFIEQSAQSLQHSFE